MRSIPFQAAKIDAALRRRLSLGEMIALVACLAGLVAFVILRPPALYNDYFNYIMPLGWLPLLGNLAYSATWLGHAGQQILVLIPLGVYLWIAVFNKAAPRGGANDSR